MDQSKLYENAWTQAYISTGMFIGTIIGGLAMRGGWFMYFLAILLTLIVAIRASGKIGDHL